MAVGRRTRTRGAGATAVPATTVRESANRAGLRASLSSPGSPARGGHPRCACSRIWASTASTICRSRWRPDGRCNWRPGATRDWPASRSVSTRASGCSSRTGRAFSTSSSAHGFHPEVLFLDASDEVLARRYSESRRPHPMAESGACDRRQHPARTPGAGRDARAGQPRDRYHRADRARTARSHHGGRAGRGSGARDDDRAGLVRLQVRHSGRAGSCAGRALYSESVLRAGAQPLDGTTSECKRT